MTTATGTKTRVQMKREGDAFVPHGDVKSYNPDTGVLVVHFDFQEPTQEPFTMTPAAEAPQSDTTAERASRPGKYTDQDGRAWVIVR